MFIYSIEQVKTGEKYIGSTGNFRHRCYQHKSDLRRGVHKNQALQKSWNEFGESAFQFAILEAFSDPSLRDQKEKEWMDKTTALFNAWNNPTKAGSKLSQETLNKMKTSAKARGISPEIRLAGTAAAAEKARGKKRDPAVIAKIKASKIGHPVSAETRAKIGAKARERAAAKKQHESEN